MFLCFIVLRLSLWQVENAGNRKWLVAGLILDVGAGLVGVGGVPHGAVLVDVGKVVDVGEAEKVGRYMVECR